MRTSKFFKTGLLLFVASLGLISCGDDDKEPEIVVDPVSENVEYYIEGKVVADNAALDVFKRQLSFFLRTFFRNKPKST